MTYLQYNTQPLNTASLKQKVLEKCLTAETYFKILK